MNEKDKELNEILEELANNLDITDTEDAAIRESYKAVGEYLAKEGSSLDKYDVEIFPQGSFNLGTIIRPIKEGDDLDIDLVCELKSKEPNWTQYDVKQRVGDRLKESKRYRELLDKEGRRCWTLLYRDNATTTTQKYHMDILPSIVDKNYKTIVREMFSARELSESDYDKAAIRITDKESPDYKTSPLPLTWLKSNPFGYARWFELQQQKGNTGDMRLFTRDDVNPLPAKRKSKTTLQRVVQLLKRHRDIHYGGDDDKPISIIITTLAAKAYDGEKDLVVAFRNVVAKMRNNIETRMENGKEVKWVPNPVNSQENFADKWPETPRKQRIFYEWLDQLEANIQNIASSSDRLLLERHFSDSFGKDMSHKTFAALAKRKLEERKSGNLRMGAAGVLSSVGSTVVAAGHNFFGCEDDE